MVDAITADIIVAISFLALLVLISALRKVHRRGEWSGTATLGAVIATFTAASVDIVITFLGDWQKVSNILLNRPWEWPGLAHQAWRALSLALGVTATVVFLLRVKRGNVPVNTPAILLVMVALASFAASVLHGDNPFRPVSVVYVVLLATCAVAPRGLGIHLGIATFCTVVALASGLTFLPWLSQNSISIFPCPADKCGILNFNFSGVMENENGLALYLALAMPFVYIGFGSWEGTALCTYILGLIMITGSRSGASAGLITFAALTMLRPNIRQPTAAPTRSALLYLGLAAAAIVGIVVPLKEQDPTAITGRGHLWILVRQVLSDPADLWHGTGVLGLQHLRDDGLIELPVYSVHNQSMQVWFSAGLIGSVLFLSALILLLWNALGSYSLVAGSVLVPVVVLSVTERPWPVDSIDWLSWAVPAALLSYPAVRHRRKPRNGTLFHPPEVNAGSNLVANERPDNALAVDGVS
jgi:hypothetical protein